MAGSVNKVILVGNLGNEPEVRNLPSGGKVVNLSIATSERWRDRNTGEQREKTEWHRVVIFSEGLAKVAEQYLRKGSKVYIEGSLRTRKYQDQSGQDRYVTEIRAEQMQMLDGAGDNGGHARQQQGQQNNQGGYNQQQQGRYNNAPAPQNQGHQQFNNNMTSNGHGGSSAPLDDDIPFAPFYGGE